VALLRLQVWKVFRVKKSGLANKADAAKRKINIIARRELFVDLQIFGKMLSDGRIGAIGTNKDVATKGRVIGAVDSDKCFFFHV